MCIRDSKYAAVIEKDGEIIAFMGGDIIEPWYSDDAIGIEYGVYVWPNHRGGKCPIMLISNFVAWCKMNNVKQIRPGISTGNTKLSGLYIALGFTKTGDNFLMEN